MEYFDGQKVSDLNLNDTKSRYNLIHFAMDYYGSKKGLLTRMSILLDARS